MLRRSCFLSPALYFAAGAVLLLSREAHAHSPIPGIGDFWNGVFHPFVAVEQGLTMVAFGLAIARAGAEAERWALRITIGAIACGLVLSAFSTPPISTLFRALPLILGGLVLIDPFGLCSRAFVPLLGSLAFVLGLSMGWEIPSDATWSLFAGGSGLGAIVIAAYAMMAWQRFHRPWFAIAARILGSWLVAIGVILLGAALR
jgi:urease accessory protein